MLTILLEAPACGAGVGIEVQISPQDGTRLIHGSYLSEVQRGLFDCRIGFQRTLP